MKPSEERESAFARHFCAAARIEGFVADINDDNRGLITAIMRVDNGKPCSYGITAFVDLGHLYESTIEQAGHYGEWLARETIKDLRRDLAKGRH